MKHFLSSVIRSGRESGPGDRSDGQGLAEYGLLLALIAVVAIASLLLLGTEISNLLDAIGQVI